MKKSNNGNNNRFSYNELQNRTHEILSEMNKQYITKTDPIYSLEDILKSKSLSDLKKLAKLLRIKCITKKNKETLLDEVYSKLISSSFLLDLLSSLTDVEWDFIREVSKRKEYSEDFIVASTYAILMELELVRFYHKDEKYYFVMPYELQKTIKSIMTPQYIRDWKHSWSINIHAMACANLYGVLSLGEFVEIYNNLNSKKIDIPCALQALDDRMFLYGYWIFDDYIVNDWYSYGNISVALDLENGRKRTPRYNPPKEDFLDYADQDNYDVDVMINIDMLISFISELSDDIDALELALEIAWVIKATSPRINDLIGIFKQKSIVCKNDKQLFNLTEILLRLNNSIRMWNNNGHTSIELLDSISKLSKDIDVKRNLLLFDNNDLDNDNDEELELFKLINNANLELKNKSINSMNNSNSKVNYHPNAPCPCGSGKKYKHCCKNKA